MLVSLELVEIEMAENWCFDFKRGLCCVCNRDALPISADHIVHDESDLLCSVVKGEHPHVAHLALVRRPFISVSTTSLVHAHVTHWSLRVQHDFDLLR